MYAVSYNKHLTCTLLDLILQHLSAPGKERNHTFQVVEKETQIQRRIETHPQFLNQEGEQTP
jgi:hypothetical protein